RALPVARARNDSVEIVDSLRMVRLPPLTSGQAGRAPNVPLGSAEGTFRLRHRPAAYSYSKYPQPRLSRGHPPQRNFLKTKARWLLIGPPRRMTKDREIGH
ncbi:MAG: hypothetical protein ABI378_09935, partial [Chitinophagaceae bacterium]